MSNGIMVSLADITGVMAAPWVESGYDAILVDPQHPEGVHTHLVCGCGYEYPEELGRQGCPDCVGTFTAQSSVTRVGRALNDPETWAVIRAAIGSYRVVFVAGFPVCTDLAVSGTAHWAAKRERDPHFQAKAMELVHECRIVGEMSGAPYLFENPVSAVTSIYRKWDYIFNPCDYGGYLPEDDSHPLYPDYYPPQGRLRKEDMPLDWERFCHA